LGKAAPSSAMTSPAGTKKHTATTASRVSVWAPPLATTPRVSRTTMAAISRQTASSRPSSRRSLERSARERRAVAASGASSTGRTVVTRAPPSTACRMQYKLRGVGWQ
jgi:hypothetical protein